MKKWKKVKNYKIEHFNVAKAIPGLIWTFVFAGAVVFLNGHISAADWVKEGENFILFYPLLVGILLYGFSVSSVFTAGQEAWKEVVSAVEDGNDEEVERQMTRRPDVFPIILTLLGAGILSVCSVYVQIPGPMKWVLFATLVVIYYPIALALDYWGYNDGIKNVQKNQ
jgi:hypothetical protein